ncbi:histidine ammonia-lyase [Clostridium sp. D2Q-11]|uniref:Histidine ammonia-lyase n=1 Tax=Anaeromonas frigoriresistens TaxID=2683708 RepID=A0A942UVJ1_9FIRM|nr:histidine ammonia-lyase [Anaeromonas frigoriresistens]MBS4537211.1 histidine ammonia-lyase [Anaeromonas frigoriresistens]
MKSIIIDGNSLTIDDLVKVARENHIVQLSEEAIEKINISRKIVDNFVDKEKIVYGITTGFGKFSDVFISKDKAKDLQKNLIISHSCGVGNPLEEEIVRAIMLLRANALAKGYSGIRYSTVETLIQMLNKGVHPVIPEKGSLGASGDLAPLSHMVLPMIGEGEVFYDGEKLPAKDGMKKAGIDIIELTSKEGLALINGTQVMTAIGALTVYDAINLSKISDVIASLSIEGLNGIVTAFDKNVHLVRPHKGQVKTARNLLSILKNSKMTTEQGELRVQDAYTLRCIPQIHGASKDAFEYVKDKIDIEINSATDNPLIFPEDGTVISGGNFHGQPMALSFDFLAIAISELGNVSERRIERLVNPALSNLPAFLVEKGGLNSGFMIVQYSAASLVSENKVLCHPSSVDSIPSSANQEDHVSMGTIGARKAREVLKNTRNILAMELLTACQAIDLRKNKGLGIGSSILYEEVRKNISKVEDDRIMYKDIDKVHRILMSEEILNEIEIKLNNKL